MLRCMAAGFTEFRLAPHSDPLGDRRGVEVVEIWSNGAKVGTLYPMEGGVKLVSKYLSADRIAVEPQQPAALKVWLR
jgi:hypothetical protein